MTRRVRHHFLRAFAATGTLALALALSGCMFNTKNSQAMVDESERVLSFAEEAMPHIASSLGMAIVKAESTPFTGGGSVGLPRSFSFQLSGVLGGPLPTQAELEEAVAAAGLVESAPQHDGHISAGTDAAPKLIAFSEDDSIQLSVTYWDIHDELRFSVTNTDTFNISDDAYDEYFPDLVPEFDQSLVRPAG